MGVLVLPSTIESGDPATAADIMSLFNAIVTHINTELIHRDGSVAFTGEQQGVAPTGDDGLVTQAAALTAAWPVGMWVPYDGGTVAPAGFVFAQGQLIDKTSAPQLFAAYGDRYGLQTGTQFYLPDLRDKTVMGVKSGGFATTLGTSYGVADAVVVAHSHTSGSLSVDISHGHSDSFSIASDTHKHDGASFAKWDASGQTLSWSGTWQSSATMALRAMSNDTHNHTLNGGVTDYSGSKGVTGSTASEGVSGTNMNYSPAVAMHFMTVLQ